MFFETGAVPPILKAATSLIPVSGRGCSKIHQELQPSINALNSIQIKEVHAPNNTVNDPPHDNVVAKGHVLESTNISDDHAPNFMSVLDVSSHVVNDGNTIVGVIPFPTPFNIFHKPSSSRARFHFGLSSSSKAFDENVDLYKNKVTTPPLKKHLRRILRQEHCESICLTETPRNIATANSKVEKVTQQVACLDSKLEPVLKSLSEIKAATPSKLDHAN
ncbi:unnamed protein product [Lactuca saligna]|uniref:Uncharacterized protein n=1 Tax=Lactuca saligna TaxID=75948 RepID=A0AA36E1W5_LACSI|nr:unnamed protein product [Lactuca saligna]